MILKKTAHRLVYMGIVLSILGCSTQQARIAEQDDKASSSAVIVTTHNLKEIKNGIKEAARVEGWRLTPLGTHKFVAEKTDATPPKVTVIMIKENVIDFDNEEGTSSSDIADLRERIASMQTEE